jgi:hypothetical protein
MKKYLLSLFAIPLFAIKPISIYQIGEKDVGFYGDFDVSFLTLRGNTETETYSVSASLQRFNEASIWFLNGSHTFSQSLGETTADSTFAHLRNIREVVKDLKSYGEIDWETFGQIEKDKFQKLASRTLLGSGLRFKPYEEYYIFFGVSPMYVKETYLDNTNSEQSFRGNFYVNFKRDLTELTSVSYTGYYQPKLGYSNDYDMTHSFLFKNRVTEELSIIFQISHDYDSHPIENVKRYDMEQKTSFTYEF